MKGTEKQIKWANEIKGEFLATMHTYLNNMIQKNATAPTEQIEKIKQQEKFAISAAEKQDDAKWWIDNGRTHWQIVAKQLLNK